jgi:heptosyltransferase III
VKLLFISATRIGDAVLSTGLLGHLLDRHPDVEVTIACGAPAQALFAAVPGLQRVIVLEKRKFAGHWFGLWAAVAAQRWDIAVDLRGSLLTGFLWRGAAIVDRHAHPQAHRVVELARLLGIDAPPAPRIWLAPSHRARAAALLPGDAPILAIAPAANWGPKTWPIERFVALMQRLTAPGAPLAAARVLVVAAPSERAQVAPLIAAIPPESLVDLSGGGDLLDVAACLERARLFVGNDSGLMHLAAAAGAPTLGLFGPSPEQRYGPWGAQTALVRTPESFETLMARVHRGETGAGAMMATLTVDAVEQAACALIARTRR